MTGHLLLVVLDWRKSDRKVNSVIIFPNRKNTTFRPKKRLKEDFFFGENVFIRPRSHKSDPFGNTELSPKFTHLPMSPYMWGCKVIISIWLGVM